MLAPLVSQLALAARAGDPAYDASAALCSIAHPADAGERALHHGDPLAACGYCDLLASHPAAPAASMPPPVLVALVVATLAPTLSIHFTPLGAFPSGRPRGPPAFFPPGR